MCKVILTILVCALFPVSDAAFGDDWCTDADVVAVEWVDDGLRIHHRAAYYNCCPDPFVYDVATEGAVLTVTETASMAAPCYCNCCFDLWVDLEAPAPGVTMLRFVWHDLELDMPMERILPVPSATSTGAAAAVVVGQGRSGCLSATGVTPEARLRWSEVKGLYR